jgi:NADH oxidase (H2O2-forming)
VVIGSGAIGIEAGEALKKRGYAVTVIELLDWSLPALFDPESSRRLEESLQRCGIRVLTSEKVLRIEGAQRVSAVVTDKRRIPCDTVVIATGVVPGKALAQTAGIAVQRGIRVNEHLQTSAPNIFACGDCAEKVSFFGGGHSTLKLASIATLEARIAGANLFGITRENPGTVGVWSTALGDFALGTAGLTEAMAKALGYDVVAATVEGPNRHPAGMPGGAKTKVKLVFESNSGVLLGGQVRGNGTAGEMINAISACVQSRMTAEDIAMFQMGTHPALTASPIAYPLVNAAELAINKMRFDSPARGRREPA